MRRASAAVDAQTVGRQADFSLPRPPPQTRIGYNRRMPSSLLAHLKLSFWSIYGRFVWDEQLTPPLHVQHVRALLAADPSDDDIRILDLGCGTGRYAIPLAQAGFHVTGIDAAPGMLACAYPKVSPALASQLRFQRMNVDEPLLFPDHHFHHVIAISVLQAVTNPVATCREVWRILKPGGSLVILHVPKPAYHDLPFVEEVRLRRRYLKRKTARNIALVALKSWGERVGGTRYWTTSQLQGMLEAQHYEIQSLDAGPPILVVAKKPSRKPTGEGKEDRN
jgi:ubiquinone/menaquinone biosynthesis C-methylase UbiE